MTLPDHNESFTDGAIGFSTGAADDVFMGFGVCSGGVADTVYGPFLRADKIVEQLGDGPLVEWGGHQLEVAAGKPIYLTKVTGSVAGANSAVAASGSGPAVTLTGNPRDDYDAQVKITRGGTRGTATFKYTLDDGETWSHELVTAATYVIPGTGITVAFALGTYVLDETYSWTSTSPGYDGDDLTAAYDVADASGVAWTVGHVIGQPTGASDAARATALATLIAAAGTLVDSSRTTKHRLRALVLEVPDVADDDSGDAALKAAIDSVSLYNKQLALVGGFCFLRSPVTKRLHRRSSAWPAVSRARQFARHIDPGWVGGGALHKSVERIEHDEYKREGLNALRITTLRTYEDAQGFFVTNFWLFAPPGSDYRYLPHWRVLSRSSKIARARMLKIIGEGFDTYPDPAPEGKVVGALTEEEAKNLESDVNELLFRKVTSTGEASKVWIEIDRTRDVKRTEYLGYRLRARMDGVVKFIEQEAGFAL